MAVLYGISQWVIPFLLLIIPLWAWLKQVSVYDCFVEGAAEGVKTAIHISGNVGSYWYFSQFRCVRRYDRYLIAYPR